MTPLSLGAAIYFDHDLAADPAPLATLWTTLASRIQAPLQQWWRTEKSSQKPKPVDIDRLVARVGSGETVAAAIESEQRGFLVLAETTPAGKLSPGVPPRHWRYDAVIALGPQYLEQLGTQTVLDALVEFAGAVSATAGIVVWSESLSYASAIAMLASGNDLTKEQAAHVTDSYYWRTHWGRVIRGPEWGTFLGSAHVAALGDISKLPAAKVVPLASGGAYVQLSSVAEATTLEAPSPQLEQLRAALAPVLPH